LCTPRTGGCLDYHAFARVDQIEGLEVKNAAGPGLHDDMIPRVTIAGENAFSNKARRDIGLDFDMRFAIGIDAEVGEDPYVAPGRGVVEFGGGCRRAGGGLFGVVRDLRKPARRIMSVDWARRDLFAGRAAPAKWRGNE